MSKFQVVKLTDTVPAPDDHEFGDHDGEDDAVDASDSDSTVEGSDRG